MIEQLKDDNSLLNYYKKVIRLKNLNPEISRGTVTAIPFENKAICAYKSEYQGSKVYIIHNVSKEPIDITLQDDVFKNVEIRGTLTVNDEKIKLKNNKLSMPMLSTIILKETK